MDQIKGKIVNVVLTVQEAKCLEFVRNQIQLSANFNGRILESDPIPAEDNPIFNTNLIWEIEKRDLRKIRSSNQPIKVDCYQFDIQRREKFGYILLDLRSAHVVLDETSNTSAIPFKWYKLIGVRNKRRNAHPELYLSLTIRSHLNEEEQQELIGDDSETFGDPNYISSIPVKYLEDGFIKIGDDPEDVCEDFSLNILLKSTWNLDLLLPEVLVFHQNKNKYCLSIKIFGVPIKTKQFSKDLHNQIVFEEKIVVRLLTKFEVLKRFFEQEQFLIGFYSGRDLLGVTTVSFEDLKIEERLLLNNCYFKFPSVNGIVPVGDEGRKPQINVEVVLIRNKKSPCNELATSKACGDFVETETAFNAEQFKEELKRQMMEELKKSQEEFALKKSELDENIQKCHQLQEELQKKLEEIRLDSRKSRRNSKTSLAEKQDENQKRFGDCDKDLLIDYISKLQDDCEELRQIVRDKNEELDNVKKTALTKEQTANLLQELKCLETKFQVAQQNKVYFKEQWRRAFEEIHELKREDYRQLKEDIRECKQELSQIQLDRLCVGNGDESEEDGGDAVEDEDDKEDNDTVLDLRQF